MRILFKKLIQTKLKLTAKNQNMIKFFRITGGRSTTTKVESSLLVGTKWAANKKVENPLLGVDFQAKMEKVEYTLLAIQFYENGKVDNPFLVAQKT